MRCYISGLRRVAGGPADKLAVFEFDAAAFGHGNPVTSDTGGLVADRAEVLS
jgi:hypothetical protein